MSSALGIVSAINATLEILAELNEMSAMLSRGEVSEEDVDEAIAALRDTNERNRQLVARINRKRRLQVAAEAKALADG